MGIRKINSKIDFISPSEEAISLHEAAHACVALIVGITPDCIEFIDDTSSPGHARNSIPVGDQKQRRLIACAAYAVEYNLYISGRLTKGDGELIDEKTFIQIAVAQNASMDKEIFFDENREGDNGCWPSEDDEAFMKMGQSLAPHIPMDAVFALAEAMLNERHLDSDRILEVTEPHLPNNSK